jgi:proteasome accessory factor BC
VRILQPSALADASREWIAAALTQYEDLPDGPID